jgi:thiol-disulfide isomerase/thioredoxin
MPKELITEIASMQDLTEILKMNDGLVIIKFGAEWCGPCKKIEQQVYTAFQQMPNNVQPVIVDVDECFEIYAFLKSKKMVKSIPTILCYKKGNISYIPNDIVIGCDTEELNHFFKTCFDKANEML